MGPCTGNDRPKLMPPLLEHGLLKTRTTAWRNDDYLAMEEDAAWPWRMPLELFKVLRRNCRLLICVIKRGLQRVILLEKRAPPLTCNHLADS